MAQEQLIRSLYDAVSNHDIEKFVSFFNENGEFKDISSDQVYRGKNEIRQMAEEWMKGFPDLKIQVSNLIGTGDTYCVEFTLVGTHKGTISGMQGDIPATGKKVNVPSCDVIRLSGGKVQSLSCYFAAPVMLNQLGIMPSRMVA